MRDAVPEGLSDLLWSFAPAEHARPRTLADVPATAPESVAMAKALKKRGFRFVGPTTAYALMQATGMVDDHVATCWRAAQRPVNTGRCLATNAAVALRWSSVAPISVCSWASRSSVSSSVAVAAKASDSRMAA